MNRVTPSASSVHRVANDFIHPRKAPNHRKVRLLTTLFLSVVTLGTLPLFAYLVTKLLAKRVSKQTSSSAAAKASSVAGKQLPKPPTLREQVLKDVEKLDTLKKDIKRAVEKGQLPEEISDNTLPYYRKFLEADLQKKDPAAWVIFLSYHTQKWQAKLVKESGLQDHPLIQFNTAIREIETQNLTKERSPIIQKQLKAFLDLNIPHPSMWRAFKFLCEHETNVDERKRLAEVYAKRWIDYIDQRSVEDLELWGLADEKYHFDRYRTHPGFECYERGFYDPEASKKARDTHQFPRAIANTEEAAKLGDTKAMINIVNGTASLETKKIWAQKIIETGTARDLRQIFNFATQGDLKGDYLKKGAELKEPVLTAVYAATLGAEDQENAKDLLQSAMVKDDYSAYLEAAQYLYRNNYPAQLDTLLQAGYEKGHIAAYRIMIQVCWARNTSEPNQIKSWVEKIAKKTHLYQLAIYLKGDEYKHARESGFDLCMTQGDAIVRRKLIQIAKDEKEDALHEKVLGHILHIADFDEMVDLLRQDESLQSRFAGKIDECAPSAGEKGSAHAIAYLLHKAVKESNVSLAEERAKKLARTGDLEEVKRVLEKFSTLQEESLNEPLKKVLPHLLNAFFPSAEYEEISTIVRQFNLDSNPSYSSIFGEALKKVKDLEVLAKATALLEDETDSTQEELHLLIASKCEHESQESLDLLADQIKGNQEIAGILRTAKMSADEAFAKIDPSNANPMDKEYRWGAALKGHREALHQIYQELWSDRTKKAFVDRFASKLIDGCSAEDAYRYSKENHSFLGQLYLSHAAAQGYRKALKNLLCDFDRGVEFAKQYPNIVPIWFVDKMRANGNVDSEILKLFKDHPSLKEAVKVVKSKFASDRLGAMTEFNAYVKKLSPAEAYEQASNISWEDDYDCGYELKKAMYEHALANNYYPAILHCLGEFTKEKALPLLKQKWSSAPPLIQLKMAIKVVNYFPDQESNMTPKVEVLVKSSDDLRMLKYSMRYFIDVKNESKAEIYAKMAIEKTSDKKIKMKICNKMCFFYKDCFQKKIPWLEMLSTVDDSESTRRHLLEAYHQVNAIQKRDALIPAVVFESWSKFWSQYSGLSKPVIEVCVNWLKEQAKDPKNKNAIDKLSAYTKDQTTSS